MNRKFALFLGLEQIAPYAAGAGLKEIYRGTDIWFDGDRLLQQVGSRVSILDLKTTEPVFQADLGVDGRIDGSVLVRVLGDSFVYTTKENGNNYFLNAYSLVEKRELWRCNSFPVVSPQPVAQVGDSIYAISQNTVFKLSRKGTLLARRDAERPHSLRATSTHIYFCSSHELYRLDARTLIRGWRSYCDPSTLHMGADGPIVFSSMLHAIARIGDDGMPAWINPAPTGFKDFFYATYSYDLSGHIVATGARWHWSPPRIEMLSQYLYLFSDKGSLIWKKPMIAWSAAIFGPYVAVLRYRGQSRKPEDQYIEIRRLIDGHLEWASGPVKFHSLRSGGEYFIARGQKESVVYRFAR